MITYRSNPRWKCFTMSLFRYFGQSFNYVFADMPRIKLITDVFPAFTHIFPHLGMTIRGNLIDFYSLSFDLIQYFFEVDFLHTIRVANFCDLHDVGADDFACFLILEGVCRLFSAMTRTITSCVSCNFPASFGTKCQLTISRSLHRKCNVFGYVKILHNWRIVYLNNYKFLSTEYMCFH